MTDHGYGTMVADDITNFLTNITSGQLLDCTLPLFHVLTDTIKGNATPNIKNLETPSFLLFDNFESHFQAIF